MNADIDADPTPILHEPRITRCAFRGVHFDLDADDVAASATLYLPDGTTQIVEPTPGRISLFAVFDAINAMLGLVPEEVAKV